MAGGRSYSRNEVDEAVVRYEQHFRGKFYSTVLSATYAFVAADYEYSGVSKH